MSGGVQKEEEVRALRYSTHLGRARGKASCFAERSRSATKGGDGMLRWPIPRSCNDGEGPCEVLTMGTRLVTVAPSW